jgi:hypothetical protein
VVQLLRYHCISEACNSELMRYHFSNVNGVKRAFLVAVVKPNGKLAHSLSCNANKSIYLIIEQTFEGIAATVNY